MCKDQTVNLVYLSSNIGLLGFATAAVAYLLSFQKGHHQKAVAPVAFALFCLATLATSVAAASMAQQAALARLGGLLLTSAIGWLAIGGHLRFNMRLIGAFVAPLATLILLVQFFVAPAGVESQQGDSPVLIGLHVIMAMVGQAFAILACAVSILYLWQQNLLKKKLLDQIPNNIPAIDRLDNLLTICLWTGFIFITLGLLSGAIYTQLNMSRSELQLELKVIWAIVIWLWYLATLLAKNIFNRPGKSIAQMSLGGFVLLAVTYFGMGFFRPLGGG